MKKYIILSIVILLILLLLPKSVPLILGFLTAIMFEGVVVFLQKKWKSNRLLPVTVIFIGFLSIIGFISYVVVAKLIEQLVYFSNNLPSILAEVNRIIGIYLNKWEIFSANVPKDLILSIESSFYSIEQSLLSATSNLTQSTILLFTSIPHILLEVLVYFISLFLFSYDLPKVKRSLLTWFSDQTKEKILFMYHQLNKAGIGFIKAQFLFSILTFLLAYSGLFILKVDYPILLSIVIMCVDILPVLGTGSVLVPLAVYSFITNSQEVGFGLLLLFLIITVIRRVIEPKVYSSSMGISPLASLISMYLGFQMIGFIGLILGPTVVIIMDTLRKSELIKFQWKI
ncbi:sporulation integral membrane protein YtvI [Bacillus salitolerans]|uniref:Sporulation integral membrane protein YtvI n=1 Tax=Bacillus salitolerans TaxID=1437434 RepID=A0ABW4LPQ5_9BACI